MTCDYCDKEATKRAKAAMGPPVNVCDSCAESLSQLYTVYNLETN